MSFDQLLNSFRFASIFWYWRKKITEAPTDCIDCEFFFFFVSIQSRKVNHFLVFMFVCMLYRQRTLGCVFGSFLFDYFLFDFSSSFFSCMRTRSNTRNQFWWNRIYANFHQLRCFPFDHERNCVDYWRTNNQRLIGQLNVYPRSKSIFILSNIITCHQCICFPTQT